MMAENTLKYGMYISCKGKRVSKGVKEVNKRRHYKRVAKIQISRIHLIESVDSNLVLFAYSLN